MFYNFRFKIGDVICHVTAPGVPMVVTARRVTEYAGDRVYYAYYARGYSMSSGQDGGHIINHEMAEEEACKLDSGPIHDFISMLRDQKSS